MFEELEKVETKIHDGQELDYDEYQKLRGVMEYFEDLEEEALGKEQAESMRKGADERAAGPALAIIVGHTKRKPGAFATDPINASEYVWNSDLAERIVAQCDVRGVEARIFFRDFVGIRGAYKAVKDWGATCAMELHFNAFNSSANGTETLYDKDTNPVSEAWAAELQSAMRKSLDLRDRKLKERNRGQRGYTSLSAIDIPTALIEPFFGDNPSDAAVAQSRKDQLAAALAEAAAKRLLTS